MTAEAQNTVFVVTSQQKNYGVEAVFSTRKLAANFSQNNPWMTITEWDIDENELIKLMGDDSNE